MTWLAGIVVTSPDLARLRDFYERGLGLSVSNASDARIEYATRGATLAIESGATPAMRLRFGTGEFDRRLAVLSQRTGGKLAPTGAAGARTVSLATPSGLAIVLDERAGGAGAGTVALSHAILEADELDGELRFWREALGLRLADEQEQALTFEAGEASLAVHARGGSTGPPLHPDQRVAFALEWPDLDAIADAVRERGFALATAPSEEAFGRFAEIEDPDGMIVVLRGPGIEEPIEERLAEDWTDDDDDDDSTGGRRMRERENPGARRVTKPASQQRSQQRKAAEKAGTQAFEEVVRGRAPGRGNYPPASAGARPPRPDSGTMPRPSRPTTPGEGASRAAEDARRGGIRPATPRPSRPADRPPGASPRPPRPPRRDES